MRKIIVAALAAVLIVVVAGGYIGWTYLNQAPSNNQPSEPEVVAAQIRDQAMVYIEANNTQTVPLMQSLAWSGGRQETGLLGSETYLYTSGNWMVQIQYPVVANPLYTITANYSSGDVKVYWVGTCQNSPIKETSKTINVPIEQTISTQEQMRDITMAYIKAYHTKTAQYMHGLMWSGGRMNTGMMVGSDTYSYQSSGWNVTIQNPVVLNPIYAILAQMHSNGELKVSWQGTLQNGTMTETSYQLKP
jgi:hypothetical protein